MQKMPSLSLPGYNTITSSQMFTVDKYVVTNNHSVLSKGILTLNTSDKQVSKLHSNR